MSCGNKLNTCGKYSYAKCTKYEGRILENGDLLSCDCHTVEEVIEDLTIVVDEIYEQVFLDSFNSVCDALTYEKNEDGKVTISEILRVHDQKLCELIAHTGLNAPTDCPECVDPCGSSSPCAGTGVVFTKYSSGSVVISAANAANWTAISSNGYNFEYVALKDGNLKLTLDFGCTEAAVGGTAMVGIGINSLSPELGNPFSEYTLDPAVNSKTVHFFLQNVKKNDILKLKFKAGAQPINISSIKMIIEA